MASLGVGETICGQSRDLASFMPTVFLIADAHSPRFSNQAFVQTKNNLFDSRYNTFLCPSAKPDDGIIALAYDIAVPIFLVIALRPIGLGH